jgi:hypothetical protein
MEPEIIAFLFSDRKYLFISIIIIIKNYKSYYNGLSINLKLLSVIHLRAYFCLASYI